MKQFYLSTSLCITLAIIALHTRAQLRINEASNRNFSQINNASGEQPDWIEIYNTSDKTVDLSTIYLSDSRKNLKKWSFPKNDRIAPHQWHVVFATGGNTPRSVETPGAQVNHWEMAVEETDTWQWINPDATTAADWYAPTFDDSSWNSGKGGFGFADDDDNTIFPSSFPTVYTRIKFSISDTKTIADAILYVDYDDGFIAYLNGVEIARANSERIGFDQFALTPLEALMYQGQAPSRFKLDMNLVATLLKRGSNTLAVECHNSSLNSSDMTLRTFLLFGSSDNSTQFRPTPSWFNEQTVQFIQEPVETNFKIASQGETLYLSDDGGAILDSLAIPKFLQIDNSYGRTTDGANTLGVFYTSTPGSSNNMQTAYTKGYEPTPVFSMTGGFYPNAISLSISSSSPQAQIRYTTDGSTPGTDDPLFTQPISLKSTTVIRARCFGTADLMPGKVAAATYFIGTNPTHAGVLCITTDRENLYGSTGIYDNWSNDWQKPCFIEYYEPSTHKQVISQNSAIRIDGGAGGSRSNNQKSFRITPGSGIFGDGDVKYRLIPSVNRNHYESFYIRNGSNQYMYYPCKDAIETRAMGQGTFNDYSGYAPVNVYINGEYWGYYELREKQDADFYKQHHGIHKDSLELLSVSYWYQSKLRALEGDSAIEHFIADYQAFMSLNTSDPAFMDKADKLFDMTYYTDYICAQDWIANTDWPFNNIRLYRGPQTGNRWRFGLIDLEWSLSPNGWSTSNNMHLDFMFNYDPSTMYIHLWQIAMKNTRYKNYFYNRYADLMNTVWLPNRLTSIANEIYNQTQPELQASYLRWKTGNIESTGNAHKQMVNELESRSVFVRQDIANHLNKQVRITLNVWPENAGVIKISTITPDQYPWSGIYFDGVPVKIEAIANPGFTFSSWDKNSFIKDTLRAAFEQNISANTTFSANFAPIDSTQVMVISEINYHSAATANSDDWIEFLNPNNTLAVDMSGWICTGTDTSRRFVFPPNTVVPGLGRVVVARNSTAFASVFPGVTHLSALGFDLGNSGDVVRLFDKNNRLITSVTYQAAAPWPTRANGGGYSLELKWLDDNFNDPNSWTSVCNNGSPGMPTGSCSTSAGLDLPRQAHFSLHPNPSRDKVLVTFSNELSGSNNDNIVIIDMMQHEVLSFAIAGNTTQQTIYIGNLQPGMYMVKVKNMVKILVKEK